MKILIIGGSRFVGPIVVKKMIESGHNLTIFNKDGMLPFYKNAKFIQGDRKNGFNMKGRFDVVIDTCAGKGEHIQKAIDELDFDFYLNFGTAASYKKTNNLPLKDDSELGDWPLWGDYNKGKVECEKILQKSGAKHVTIRPIYILGENNYVDRENFIYSRIKNKISLILPGDGEAKTQFVFVENVADSIVLLAENKIQGAFNCCGDEVVTLKELVEIMGEIVGTKPVMEFNPNANGEGHDSKEFQFANEDFYCTNTKLKNLGIAFTPLAEGLKKGYENYYKKLLD